MPITESYPGPPTDGEYYIRIDGMDWGPYRYDEPPDDVAERTLRLINLVEDLFVKLGVLVDD